MTSFFSMPPQDQLEVLGTHLAIQFVHMTIMWIICMVRHNGSMVDFGWPSGFLAISTYYFLTGTGDTTRRIILCVPIMLQGLRFNFGWLMRGHLTREDHRWNMWRERWRQGEGWGGIRSVAFNFFLFYHAQGCANAHLGLILYVVVNSDVPVSAVQYIGLAISLLSFALENVADHQLSTFAKQESKRRKEAASSGVEFKRRVMCTGLWRYSRHPNYFFEVCIWLGHAIQCLPFASTWFLAAEVLFLPIGMYYFIVHFTGVWMAEQASLKRRGEAYAEYIRTTNMILPWLPRK
eukprot:PhM_4_TR5446/c0_g1_i1/m.46232